jgi:hypothetical protein
LERMVRHHRACRDRGFPLSEWLHRHARADLAPFHRKLAGRCGRMSRGCRSGRGCAGRRGYRLNSPQNCYPK